MGRGDKLGGEQVGARRHRDVLFDAIAHGDDPAVEAQVDVSFVRL
jgi:hypothetical protein